MFGGHYEDFIPVMYRHYSLKLDSYRDLLFMGKESLQCLARFWEKHAKTCDRIANDPKSNYEKREYAESQAREERYMAGELRRFAKEAESKPNLFERPTFRKGLQVTCFLENPDRYVSGVLVKVKAEAEMREDDVIEIKDAILIIRTYDQSGQHLIEYAPDGFTLFTTEDFEFFQAHWSYFKFYLNYHTWTIPERDKVNRMLYCLSGQPNPPEVA